MREYQGVDIASIPEPRTKEATRIIDVFLQDLSYAMRRIEKGQVPNSSGGAIMDVLDTGFFFKLAGRSGGQTGHGGTLASQNLTLASTANATKGFVYLGNARQTAYAETSERIGINQPVPTAKVHIKVGNPVNQFTRPSTDASNTGGLGWQAVGASNNPPSVLLADRINEVVRDDTNYIHYDDGFGTSTYNTISGSTLTNPGASATGYRLRFAAKMSTPSNSVMSIQIKLANNNGVNIVNKFAAGSGYIGTKEWELGTSFAPFTYTLDAAEIALINFSSQPFRFEFVAAGSGTVGRTMDVSWIEFEVPQVGGGSAETLQKWENASFTESLDFATDGSGGATAFDLALTGTAPLMIGSGGGTSGVRILTSSTNGRIEAGSAAAVGPNLVLSGNRDTTGTLITSKFTTHEFTGALKWDGATSGALTHQAAGTTTDYTLTWPNAQGAASSFLVNNGSGTLTWQTISGAAFLHELLSATHSDTTAGTVVRADIITAQGATAKWTRLAIDTTATRYLSNTGTANEPAWAQVNLANGVTGVLPIANGGTNKALTLSAGGIVWTDADSFEVLAGTATAGQILRSGASVTPSWSTATYPATAGTSGNFLQSDGTNWNSTTLTAAMLPSHDHSSSTTGGSTLYPQSTGAANTPLKVKGFAGQTAPLTEWQDSAAGFLARLTASGGLRLGDDLELLSPTGNTIIDASNSTTTRLQILQDSDGTIPLLELAQTWTALQTFRDTTFKVVDDGDPSKTLVLSLGSAAANADLTISYESTNDRTLRWILGGNSGTDLTFSWTGTTTDRTVTIPNATFTMAGLNISGGQTFTTKQTISIDATGTDDQLTLNDTAGGFSVGLRATPTANRALTIPDVDGALAAVAGFYEADKSNSVTTTNLVTSPVAGNYVISYTLECDVADAGETDTVAITFGWTDPGGPATFTTSSLGMNVANTRLTDNYSFSVRPSAGNITYAVTVTGTPPMGTARYAYSVSVVQIPL